MIEALDLRTVDEVELGVRLIDDLAVGEHAGAVNEPANRPELAANLGEGGLHRGAIAHVDRGMVDDCEPAATIRSRLRRTSRFGQNPARLRG